MNTYQLTRKIPVEEGYDLVVAGGGPAGAAAAICAGRLGARVLLIEATGCLGGMGTSGLVTAFDPMANGERMLVGGLMKEIVETLYERRCLKPGIDPDTWRKHYHEWTPFKPEGLKLVLDELSIKAGVEVRFFTRVIDVDVEAQKRRIDGVIINNVEGYSYVRAKAVIDATGNAVLAHLCGVQCREAGRDTARIMPASLCSLYANIDWERGGEGLELERQRETVLQAVEDGHFSQPDRHLGAMSRIGDTLGYLNACHLFNLNALRCRDLTDGIMLGRRLAEEYTEFYRKYIPGCENIEHVTTASLIGIRESRRIVGEYELNFADYLARRQFPDQIGLFNKFVDIHPYEPTLEEYNRFKRDKYELGRIGPGEYFGIPYSIIVPKGWLNLWVPGRAASSDIKVHGSIRVQPVAAMMGQAAGTAAVQHLRTGQAACDLDTAQLVESLRKAGAYLPQAKLSSEMTR